MYKLSYKFNNDLRTSKLTKIYYKLNVFNVAYQQRIRIVFLFNSKINEKLANKTDNRREDFGTN